MAERRWLLSCALASLALLGCQSEGQPMLLDWVCGQYTDPTTNTPPCAVSGDAEVTTGLSSESTAIRLGSNGGVFRMRLNALLGVTTTTTLSLDVLAAANPIRADGNVLFRTLTWGSCGTQCPAEPSDSEAPLEEDFAWAQMLSEIPGATTFPPDDALIELRGADIDIIDIRVPGAEGIYY